MKLKLVFLTMLLQLNFSFAAQVEKDPIIIGIAPHSSTREILASHQDLREFVGKYFKRPVQIITAKNFSEFSRRSNEGSYYDLILTSPNLAVLAQRMGGYTPLLTYQKGLSAVILSKDKDILKKEKFPLHVIGLDPVSFPTQTAQNWLEEQGFHEGEQINYTYTSAADSSISILLNNDADMIIMSLPNYNKLINEKTKNLVEVVYKSEPKPSRIYLAKNRNGITLDEWKKALNIFRDSIEGKNHLKTTKLIGFKDINQEDLDALEPIVKVTKKRLYE